MTLPSKANPARVYLSGGGWRPAGRHGHRTDGRGHGHDARLEGSVALSLCATAHHPLHTRSAMISGPAVSESTMRPNPLEVHHGVVPQAGDKEHVAYM